jgi:DNA-binding response OmpR family regulator
MVARVKANLAQYERLAGHASRSAGELSAGNLRINTKARRVYVDENEIELKNKEYELLLFLASNRDVVFSKESLYERIWGMDALGDSATVAVHINRIREKIERDPSDPAHIETVWGVGYRFK